MLDWIARRYAVAHEEWLSRASSRHGCASPIVSIRAKDRASRENRAPLLDSYAGGADLLDAHCTRNSGRVVATEPSRPRSRHLISELRRCARRRRGARHGSRGSLRIAGARRHREEVAGAGARGQRAGGLRASRVRGSLLQRDTGSAQGAGPTVLAPMPNLRLLVVDEEHHSSYKEDRSPRYHARTVGDRARPVAASNVRAGERRRRHWKRASRCGSGEWQVVPPTRQARRAARPIVEVVNLSRPSRSKRRAARPHARGPPLRPDESASGSEPGIRPFAVVRRVQAIASLSRVRGRAFLRSPERDRPLLPLSLERKAPDVCPTCGASEWKYMGAGSERLAGRWRKRFPRATVRRVDPSTLDESLGTSRDADIYVTTWIGTKPVLRPDVGLVGVLNADALIRRAECRSAEDAYQALAEMAEWAGPASTGRTAARPVLRPGPSLDPGRGPRPTTITS